MLHTYNTSNGRTRSAYTRRWWSLKTPIVPMETAYQDGLVGYTDTLLRMLFSIRRKAFSMGIVGQSERGASAFQPRSKEGQKTRLERH